MLIFNAIQYKQLKFFYLIHLSYVLSFYMAALWFRSQYALKSNK